MTFDSTATTATCDPRSPVDAPTNDWTNASPRPLSCNEMIVEPGRDGAAYQHHPHLSASPDGRLLLTWSQGERDEDMQGQRVMFSESADEGQTWSKPRVLAEPPVGTLGPLVLTNGGIHAHDEGWTAYINCYERTYFGMLMYYATGGNAAAASPGQRMMVGAATWIWHSPDAGRTWDHLGAIDRGISNHPPQRLRDGRLILPGHVSFPFTDDPTGRSGWQRSGLPNLPDDHVDDPERTCRAEGPTERGGDRDDEALADPTLFGEGTCFQKDDGAIVMMLRSPRERLAFSVSQDGGRSWSTPRWSDYTDCRSRSQFGRLPDGRYFGLNTPEPHSPRTPLVLALSEDGRRFDRQWLVGDQPNVLPKIHGVHKYGRYGYPSMCVRGRSVIVAYSINKEDIAVSRFSLSQLDD